MRVLAGYLWHIRRIIALAVAGAAVFSLIFFLYRLPGEPLAYGLALTLAAGALLAVPGARRFARTHRELERQAKEPGAFTAAFDKPDDLVEQDYQQLARSLAKSRESLKEEEQRLRQEQIDYYTLWAHQIKTPIAAMELLLQEPEPDRRALDTELFRINEYVGLVLSYLRLGSPSSDYLFRKVRLDDLVRSAVKKYSRLFIIRKISVRIIPTGRVVITDEKWLGFVIGQILSNALKYTPPGGSITIKGAGDSLVIADTGIGIAPEDLPRLAQMSYTGYNGHRDKNSSGIGLYLSKQVMGRLGGQIRIASEPGKGTAVSLELPEGPEVTE